MAIALAAGFLTLSSVSPTPASAVTPPMVLTTGFSDQPVFSGLWAPTAMRFASDGSVYVAEKRGTIARFPNVNSNTPTRIVDLTIPVFNYLDRGLLGLALDPNFPATPYIYVNYAFNHTLTDSPWNPANPNPKWQSTTPPADPSYPAADETCPTPPGDVADGCVVSSRISRLTLDPTNGFQMIAGSEKVLVEDYCQQFPSHSAGALNFGTDGYLYAGGGAGDAYTKADYGQYGVLNSNINVQSPNPCGDPGVSPIYNGTVTKNDGQILNSDEGGSLRSQAMWSVLHNGRTQPVGLDGTIIRIDPATGAGAPGNPFASSTDANAKRIVAYGLRNPFRWTFQPGTLNAYLGDVGADTWEEVDSFTTGSGSAAANFGWPCYEGAGQLPSFSSYGLTLCGNLTAAGPGAVKAPLYTYQHKVDTFALGPGTTQCDSSNGSSVSGQMFYPTSGGTFPPTYKGALFMADYSRSCLMVMLPDAPGGNPNPNNVKVFASNVQYPVDLQVGPGDGALYYVSVFGGFIHKIVYNSASVPPIPALTATVPSPINGQFDVTLDASGSSDPNVPAQTLTYLWTYGDGTGTLVAGPNVKHHTYSTGTYNATVRVTNTAGLYADLPVTINAGHSAPVPTILTPTAGTAFKVGDTLNLSGSAVDSNGNPVPPSGLLWTIDILHCPSTGCHTHRLLQVGGSTTQVAAPDHQYPSSVQITLTATDSFGATASVVRNIAPIPAVVQYNGPPGLQMIVPLQPTPLPAGGVLTWIAGGSAGIQAPPSYTNGIDAYTFLRWSDGDTNPRGKPAAAGGTILVAQYKRNWHGYYLVAGDGGIFTFGGAHFKGSTGNLKLNKPVVGMSATASGDGYYLVAADGGVFTFGDSLFQGSAGNLKLNAPVIGMTLTPSGDGYWLFAADGGVFTYGDAPFLGSTGNVHLSSPVIGMAAKKDASGYWLFAADGTVYPFGTAAKLSGAAIPAGKQVAAMGPTASGNGYWLATTDGNVYPFGDAANLGGVGNLTLSKPIVGMMVTPTGLGYWLLAGDGGVFTFGDATFFGSTGNLKLNSPVVSGAGGLG